MSITCPTVHCCVHSLFYCITHLISFNLLGAHYNLLHPCQFGGLRQKSTEDAGVYLTHLVRAGWAQGLKTSVVAFDLAQYVPSLNHSAITLVLDRMGFADSLVNFIADYLVGRDRKSVV